MKTTTSMQRFEDQNGKSARITATLVACMLAGLAVVAALLIPELAPGLAAAFVAAIPHWLSRPREDQP